jgi:hypothetical protein
MSPLKRDLIFVSILVIALLAQNYLAKHHSLSRQDMAESSLYMWPQLMRTKIHTNYLSGTFSAEIAEDVKQLAGKDMTIGGYMVPLDPSSKSSHFLLSRRASTCSFCSAGEPNEIIEVEMQKPLQWTDSRIVLTGVFELIDNQKEGLFYKLNQAKPIVMK